MAVKACGRFRALATSCEDVWRCPASTFPAVRMYNAAAFGCFIRTPLAGSCMRPCWRSTQLLEVGTAWLIIRNASTVQPSFAMSHKILCYLLFVCAPCSHHVQCRQLLSQQLHSSSSDCSSSRNSRCTWTAMHSWAPAVIRSFSTCASLRTCVHRPTTWGG